MWRWLLLVVVLEAVLEGCLGISQQEGVAEPSGEVVAAPPNPKSSHFCDQLGIAPFLSTGLDPMLLRLSDPLPGLNTCLQD
jgi:hypothetical protein